MTTIVCFRTPEGLYGLPVGQVNGVHAAAALRPLPAPRPGVVGLVAVGEESLPVLSVLGSEGGHIVVVDDGALVFGLLVEEVTSILHVADTAIGPAPSGQDRAVVAGVLNHDGNLVLMLDLTVLRGRLAG